MKIDFEKYSLMVLGVSAGGMEVLRKLLPFFGHDFPLPVVIIQHLHPNQGEFYLRYFNDHCNLNVQEAVETELVRPGNVYFAPPNYHLLIDLDKKFRMNVDPRVNFSRPSIDVFFESAAEVFKDQLIGVILTGANDDGALGMKAINDAGGYTIAQDPQTAEVYTMPLAAIEKTKIDWITRVEELGTAIQEYDKNHI
ncbi:MAG: chemotaxis protein CheB [Marinilabiliales bacterium]|nr:MAG: chemotaxis protein CheB [Marinilabiliales bacterium]